METETHVADVTAADAAAADRAGTYATRDTAGQMLDFGEAIRALRSGNGTTVSRIGWNGKDMFLYYVPEGQYPARTKAARDAFGEDGLVPYRPYIAMKTAQGDVVPWVASQSDILADDWIIGAN
jgi:hypothetical protein